MYIGEKRRIHSRSFHHRIREGAAHFFDTNHFLGMDPMDLSRFHNPHEDVLPTKKKVLISEEDLSHLISNW
jgi:hypothetical protein